MSNSSQQTNSLDDLLKDLTITLSDDSAITLTGAVGASDLSYSYNSNMSASTSTITLSPGFIAQSVDTISIDNSSFIWKEPVEWVDSFPDWTRIKDMCNKYPAMEIAMRNLETVYQLVKDDYDNPVPKK